MATWLERAARWAGATETARPVRRYTAALLIAAVLIMVAGFAFERQVGSGFSGTNHPTLRNFGIVTGLVVFAHLFGLRMRIGPTTFSFGWGEAAVIIGFTCVPAGWLPAAVWLGVLIAKSARQFFGVNGSVFDSLRTASALTVCAGLAAGVVAATGVTARPLDPSAAAVIALAAMTYLLATAVMLAIHLRIREGQAMLGVLRRALASTPVMVVGNLILGLITIGLMPDNRNWIWVLPPLLLLLQQLYMHRARDDEERRTWGAFATASRSLHRLDELAVAQEGLRAAKSLFAVRAVELTVIPSQHRYRLGPDSDAVTLVSHPDDDGAAFAALPTVSRPLEVAGAQVGLLELRLHRAGSWRGNDQHRLAAFSDGLAAALHDAATHGALRELRERAVYEAAHDPLTRLLNRDSLLDRGDGMLRAFDPWRPVALLLFDVDHFKEVNDTLGHLAGDQLLQITAARLAADANDTELVARLGGDEFGLLVTDLPMTQPGDTGAGLAPARAVALRRARYLADRLAAPTEVAGVMLSAEVSVGVVVAPASPTNLTEMLRRADIALYHAKESGTRAAVYDLGRDQTSTDRLALVAEVRAALAADDQLFLEMQPVADLRTGAPIGVEALVRWQHPRRGLLTPIHFVRAIEASDLLGQFTRHVIDQALAAAAGWERLGWDLPVAVNLSPRSLLDPKLPRDIAQLLQRHRMPAGRLTLEIIETVVLSPLPITDQVLKELRALGVRLAVDDFGTGFSSLTFLTRITVDELKIDRTFVGRMAESKQANAIVRAVVDLGRQLGVRVIAEGVETAAQRQALLEIGCEAGQGFHFGRPVAVEQIGAELEGLRKDSRAMRLIRSEPGRADTA